MFVSTIGVAIVGIIAPAFSQSVNPMNLKPTDSPDFSCPEDTVGSICQPVNDPVTRPIGDHINNDLLVTGFPGSQAVSIKLLFPPSSQNGSRSMTQLEFHQYNVGEVGTRPFYLVSGRQKLILGPIYENAFAASFQFPCSLFDGWTGEFDEDNRAVGNFTWSITHYYGEGCSANNTDACTPVIKDLPSLWEPREVPIIDNPSICGR